MSKQEQKIKTSFAVSLGAVALLLGSAVAHAQDVDANTGLAQALNEQYSTVTEEQRNTGIGFAIAAQGNLALQEIHAVTRTSLVSRIKSWVVIPAPRVLLPNQSQTDHMAP